MSVSEARKQPIPKATIITCNRKADLSINDGGIERVTGLNMTATYMANYILLYSHEHNGKFVFEFLKDRGGRIEQDDWFNGLVQYSIEVVNNKRVLYTDFPGYFYLKCKYP